METPSYGIAPALCGGQDPPSPAVQRQVHGPGTNAPTATKARTDKGFL